MSGIDFEKLNATIRKAFGVASVADLRSQPLAGVGRSGEPSPKGCDTASHGPLRSYPTLTVPFLARVTNAIFCGRQVTAQLVGDTFVVRHDGRMVCIIDADDFAHLQGRPDSVVLSWLERTIQQAIATESLRGQFGGFDDLGNPVSE